TQHTPLPTQHTHLYNTHTPLHTHTPLPTQHTPLSPPFSLSLHSSQPPHLTENNTSQLSQHSSTHTHRNTHTHRPPHPFFPSRILTQVPVRLLAASRNAAPTGFVLR